jgi:SAM-dependent methyltransferase
MNKAILDYEEGYHQARHGSQQNPLYYEARAKVALVKFFYNTDINLRILDYGCGMGQNIALLSNAVGYDISHFSVGFAKGKGLNATNNLDDLDDESFDVVFSAHTLEHHPYPKTMLEEMYAKLKPGGKLILVLPHERHGKASFELDLNQHLYNWNFQNINNLLLLCNYKVTENRYVYGIGYNVLLPVYKYSFNLYYTLTNLLSKLNGIKELMITAYKPENQ